MQTSAPDDSAGRWDVDTYLDGKKTSSGMHRTEDRAYIPHGVLRPDELKSGQRFEVRARVVTPSGRRLRLVSPACRVPGPDPPAGSSVFEGGWTCDDRGAQRPIEGARVELRIDADGPPDADPLVASGWTERTGRFALTAPTRPGNHYVLLVPEDREGVHVTGVNGARLGTDTPLATAVDGGRTDLGSRVIDARSTHCAVYRGMHAAWRQYVRVTGRPPPYGDLYVAVGGLAAEVVDVPFTSFVTVRWPAGYPVDPQPGRLGTAFHEFGHTIRHGLDGNAAWFAFNAARFLYTRHHSPCARTNPGFAFNEGWAEYWGGDYAPAPDCPPPVTRSSLDVEGNVGFGLAELDRWCKGVDRGDMVEVLRRGKGDVHSFEAFRSRLECPGKPWAAEACGEPLYEPPQFAVSCDGARHLDRLRWRWGNHAAKGRGFAVINTCRPSCAQGSFERFAVDVTLSAPRRCPTTRRRQFRRLEYRFRGAAPGGRDSRVIRSLACTLRDP